MNGRDETRARLARLQRTAGSIDRDLRLGVRTIRFEGLSERFASLLERRWGGFSGPVNEAEAALVVRVVGGDGSLWLPLWSPGEHYRIEAETSGGAVLVRSYHFALVMEAPGRWRLAVEDRPDEPVDRVFDNAARYLVARDAIEQGGVALHGAGIVRHGRAWIFAGPSGSGKSTAVSLSMPAQSLGDDFAVIVPAPGEWATHAVPFDNAERAPAEPVAGLVPLAGVLRLHKSASHRLERPHGIAAQVSLMTCAAFPWALGDLADRSADAIAGIAASGLYAHLHFARDPGFWPLLEPGA